MSFDLKIIDRDGRLGEVAANITEDQRQHIVEYLMQSRFKATNGAAGNPGGPVAHGGGGYPVQRFVVQPVFTSPGCLHDPDLSEAIRVRDDGTYVKCKHCGEFYRASVILIGGGGGGAIRR